MRHDKKRVARRVIQVLISCGVAVSIVGALIFVSQGRDMPVLHPAGTIAQQEFNLIMLTVTLGFFVVVPVFIMLFTIAWKYRASNKKAKYDPEFGGHRGIEALWWGIPCAIILALAIITGIATHQLDPYKSLSSSVKPVKVEVIAMEWKWLFLYPDQNAATLNYLNIPKDTPINLTITADAPMNSFWVPALAGQVYAMSGMSTQLHFMANSVGSYYGSSANISGDGFADMHFKVNSMNQVDFAAWAIKASQSPNMLDDAAYKKMETPSKNDPHTDYMLMDSSLYDKVIMKYMIPKNSTNNSQPMNGMDMSGMSM